MLQTQVNYWSYIENKRHNYAVEEANLMQAKAALSQAESASRNADTNAYNALINRENAETNRINAMTNVRNADINAFNAQTDYEAMLSQKKVNTAKVLTETSQNSVNLAQESYLKQQRKESEAKTESTRTNTKLTGVNVDWAEREKSASTSAKKAETFKNITGGISNLITIIDKLVPNVSIDQWK